MPIIEINNKQVHVQELNKGAQETVVLLHGMFSNLSVYYFNIAPLLAKHFHVVMYDLKSHGLSERVKDGYDLNSMIDDLNALLNKLSLSKVHLAGYSFGGLIALKMAANFPEKIKKLLVIEAPDPSDDKTRDIIDDYSKEFLEHYVANFTDTTKSKMGKRQMEKNHQMYEYLFHKTSIKSDMLLEKSFFKSPEISLVKNETMVVYGADSNCLDAGKSLQSKLENAILVTLAGDHNIPIQAPIIVANTMQSFFTKTACA